MDGSILEDIRKMIGPSADYDGFDVDLMININATFNTLFQLGVGVDSSEPFQITGADETWSDFTGNDAKRNYVKQYIYIKTRLIFDPPQSGSVIDAYKSTASELETRMLLMEEIPAFGGTAPSFAYDNYKFDEATGRWVDGDEQ